MKTVVAGPSLQQETGYELAAVDDLQLKAAHGKMIEWARGKQLQCDAEKAEQQEALSVAEERKWATSAFKSRIKILERRRVFYEKIEIALLAGYVIVPNFQMTVFAIRTNDAVPRGGVRASSWRNQFVQNPQLLKVGEGEYQNPVPKVLESKTEEPDGKGGTKVTKVEWPADEFDDLDFPIALAKPVLMSRTAAVMAERLFDEIGVAVDTQQSRGTGRGGDPILLGRFRNPRQGRPDVSFFIGWYFDPSRI